MAVEQGHRIDQGTDLHLGADAADRPHESAQSVPAAAEVERRLRRSRADDYFRFLERVNLGHLNGQLTFEQVRDFQVRLRQIATKELDATQVEKIFEHSRPSAEFLARVIEYLQKTADVKIIELDRWDTYEVREGQLYGRVKADGKWLPIVGNKLISELPGSEHPDRLYEIESVDQVLYPAGRLATTATIVHGTELRRVPVWHGRIQESIQADDSQPIDGQFIWQSVVTDATETGWSGTIERDDQAQQNYLVHDSRIIDEIEGRTIERGEKIHDHDGKLCGLVKFANDDEERRVIYEIVLDGDVVKQVGSYEYYRIEDANDITFQTLNGRETWHGMMTVPVRVNNPHGMSFTGELPRPVINGQEVLEIDGVKIVEVRNIWLDEAGRPNGMVRDEDNNCFPLIAGKIIRDIEDQEIMTAVLSEVRDDTWFGLVKIKPSHDLWPVWRGQAIKRWKGEEVVHDIGNRLFEIDGTVNGEIRVQRPGGIFTERLVLESPTHFQSK